MPTNVELHLVSMASPADCVSDVRRVLAGTSSQRYDVIVVDGLYRREMAELSKELVSEDGIIICDNAEGYGFYQAFAGSGFNRVDFHGFAPGVVLPHVTSVLFKAGSFTFSCDHTISA